MNTKPKLVKPVRPGKRSLKRDPVVDSIDSILALLRGIGPVLVGSSPNQAEVMDLIAGLKDPVCSTKEDA